VFAEKEEPSSPLRAAGLSNGVKFSALIWAGIHVSPRLSSLGENAVQDKNVLPVGFKTAAFIPTHRMGHSASIFVMAERQKQWPIGVHQKRRKQV